MAADKKKVDKKAAEKKTTKKVVAAKAPVKKGKKNVAATDLTISVPRGGQIIKHFNLAPALPTDCGRGDWLFAEEGSTQDIETLTVRFELNPSALERQLERAVLIVSMVQNAELNGTWRFALGGVATDQADEDPNNDVVVEIIDNGFTLVAYVQVLENSAEYIPFGFVASFTSSDTGVVSIYESQDPGVVTKRP
ncbi:MAG: DP-EP family protein [Cellvibrio sp.]|uniref:DP-EP family protein n=1 Tax=Cellvibrio sp. TaxID=1965322 RepID=UPI0031B0E83D